MTIIVDNIVKKMQMYDHFVCFNRNCNEIEVVTKFSY